MCPLRPVCFIAFVLCPCAIAQTPDELVRRLKDPERDVRRLAAEELGKRKVESAIPHLAKILKDGDAAVRKAAANALIQIGPKSISALTAALTYQESFSRLASLDALLRIAPAARDADKDTLMALATLLKDKNVDVRIHAAAVLGTFGPSAKSTLPGLVEAAKDVGNLGDVLRPVLPAGVAEAAVQAALKIDPDCGATLAKAILPDLIAALQKDDMAIVQAAARALAALGKHAAPAVPALQKAQERAEGFAESAIARALTAAAEDPLRHFVKTIQDAKQPLKKRLSALSELKYSEVPDDKMVAILIDVLKDPEPELRAEAVDCVHMHMRRNLDANAALPALLALLGDTELEKAARSQHSGADCVVAQALARIGAESAPGLVKVLQDDKQPHLARFQAARALATMGRKGKSALPTLEIGMKDRIASVALESACAYVRAGGDLDKALPIFGRGLKHSSTFIAWSACHAIERVGAQADSTVPDLLPLLKHSEREVRIVAAHALSKMGPAARPAVPALAELLKDSDGRQRYQISYVLEELGSDAREALPALIQSLDDMMKMSPNPILVTLGKLGPAAKPAMPKLLKLLENADSIFANDVMDVLGRIGPDAKESVPKLIERLAAKSPYARAAAARALGGIGSGAQAAVVTLKKILLDEEKQVRVWAAFALARITGDSKSHVAYLMELWKDAGMKEGLFPGSEHYDIARALELLGPEAQPGRDLLLAAVLDEKTPLGTRNHAARALAHFQQDADDIVPKLLTLLNRKTESFKRVEDCKCVCEAVRILGPKAKAAIPHLKRLLDDEENEVVEAAAQALKHIGGK